ncbi:MAG: discoidin domain-containing protein [Chitinophagaceae bacterium]
MKTIPFILKPFIAILLLVVVMQTMVKAQSSDPVIQTNITSSQVIYANMAVGKSVTVSSTDNASHPASYAVDGNASTRFATSYNDNEWLIIDLGKTYLLNNVTFLWDKAYGKDFTLLFSNNGSFTDLYSDSVQIKNHVLSAAVLANGDVINLKSNTQARYVKMQGIHSATSNGYSIFEMQVFGTTSSTGLFPVSVSNLTVTPIDNGARLDWNTVTEYNNAGFSIERSSDAVNFTAVGWVNAKNGGTVATRYTFTDKLAVGKNYYRLKQTWLDGKIGYSNVLVVNANGKTNISTYPVPATDHVVVEYAGVAGENISMALFNANGMPVYNNKLVAQGGTQTIVINRTASMSPGKYFLVLQSSNSNHYTEKIILQ